MSRNLGDAFVRVRPDTSGFQAEANRGLSGGLKKVAGVVAGAFASREILRGAQALVDSSSRSQQSIGATEQVFKKYADTVIRRSKQAAGAVGLAASEYRELANVTGAMLKSSGMPLEKVANLTDKLNKRAADLAATYGGSTRQALEAVSSLLRGEADPIEAYGVSIKQSDVNARLAAQGLGELEGAAKKQAEQQARLTLLFEQSADAQGQSRREADQWAGVSERAAARAENLKAKIGNGLLPVWAAAGKVVADELLPQLTRLTNKHMPRLVKSTTELINGADLPGFFRRVSTGVGTVDWSQVSGSFGTLADKVKGVDWSKAAASTSDIASSAKDLAPVAKDLAGQLPGLNDLLTVTGEVMGFAADHVDTLRAALPYLVAGFIALKVAQLASNVVTAASPAIRIAEVIATRAQTKAIREQTLALRGASVAQVQNGVVTGVTTKMTIRQRVAALASAAASKVVTAATKVWTVAMKALNLVMRMNPIGRVITALIALGAGLVLAYKKSETFRRIVDGVFSWLKKVFTEIIPDAARTAWDAIGGMWTGIKEATLKGINWVLDKLLWWAEKILGVAAKAFGWAGPVGDQIKGALDKVKGFREDVNRELDGIKDEAVTVSIRAGQVASFRSGDAGIRAAARAAAAGGAGRIPTGAMGGGPSFRMSAPMSPVHQAATQISHGVKETARTRAQEIAEVLKQNLATSGTVLPKGSYQVGMPYLGYPGHYGADYPAPMGTAVRSLYAGRVIGSYDLPGSNPYNDTPYRSYGRVVKVAHSNGMQTLYAHLAQRLVTAGQSVAAGQLLGTVGMNGNATGPHLHFEARRGGVLVNPASLGVFDRGGVARGLGFMPKRVIEPERVLSPRQTGAFEDLVDVLTGPRRRAGGGRVEMTITNWDEGRGYFTEVAGDEYDDRAAHARRTRRRP